MWGASFVLCCPSLTLQGFCFPFTVSPECLSLLPRVLLWVVAAIDPSSLTQASSSKFASHLKPICGWGAPRTSLAAGEQDGGRFTVHLNFIPQSDCFRENMPSHFKFKEYCPMVFRNLRERFGIDDQDFQVSCFHNIYFKWVSLVPSAP